MENKLWEAPQEIVSFNLPPRKPSAQCHVSLLATELIWAILTVVLELSA